MIWQVDEIASWWNGKLLQYQVNEMASWLVDKMASWLNSKLANGKSLSASSAKVVVLNRGHQYKSRLTDLHYGNNHNVKKFYSTGADYILAIFYDNYIAI